MCTGNKIKNRQSVQVRKHKYSINCPFLNSKSFFFFNLLLFRSSLVKKNTTFLKETNWTTENKFLVSQPGCWGPFCSSFQFPCSDVCFVFVIVQCRVPNVACASGFSILDFLFGYFQCLFSCKFYFILIEAVYMPIFSIRFSKLSFEIVYILQID